MFIRPAMSESQFDLDDSMEWGISDPFEPEPVSHHPADWPDPHPLPSPEGALPATADEALWFWMRGGWDE